MRRVLLALAVVGCGLAALERRASALSCDWWPWHVWSFGGEQVPVDFRPWMHVDCSSGATPEEQFGSCTLVTAGHTVPVTFESRGAGACELSYETSVYGSSPEYVVFFVPGEPLLPGRTYQLACGEQESSEWQFTTRATDEPAAPPQEVAAKIRYVQGDEDGCCGGSDYLTIEFVGHSAPYLTEGGLIEVRYPTGEVVPVTADAFESSAAWDLPVDLPPSLGPLELTPIAADGTRGSTTRIERDDIYVEPVYIPCAVSKGSHSLALWLLGPLLWIGTRGRRRSR